MREKLVILQLILICLYFHLVKGFNNRYPTVICGGGHNDNRYCQDISSYIAPLPCAKRDDVNISTHKRCDIETRTGHASLKNSCEYIRQVPADAAFISKFNFYEKYTEAYGIPVLGSKNVSDKAIMKACFILRFIFADRQDIREMMYKHFGRVAVIGIQEETTDIPEHAHLPPWWNQRARGLGAMVGIPVSTGGEENLLCKAADRYYGDDIFFHEVTHAVAELAIKSGAIPGFYERLEHQYDYALRMGLWNDTYSQDTVREYFAEGAQIFFENHPKTTRNGVHGNITSRSQLAEYDPGLYSLLVEAFPCMNSYQRCPNDKPNEPSVDCEIPPAVDSRMGPHGESETKSSAHRERLNSVLFFCHFVTVIAVLHAGLL